GVAASSAIESRGTSRPTREALPQYESRRRMLGGQRGARPSSALGRARSALGAGRTAERDARVPALVRAEPTRTTPLVGRAVEHARIAMAVSAAVAGNSSDVLWITGEPGIGKTRLLEEAAALVREANGIVLAGRAYEAE